MTQAARRAFEEQWPALASRLHGMLARKGLPPEKRDDVVQETGLRLYGMWKRTDPGGRLWGLTVTIALNLLRDEARRRRDREVLGGVPDMAGDYDVERAGLALVELKRVGSAMTRLSPAHRSALLSEIGYQVEDARGGAATKMLRLRARKKLHTLLDTATASGALLALRLRRLLTLGEGLFARGFSSVGDESTATVAAALVAVLGLTGIAYDDASLGGGGTSSQANVMGVTSESPANLTGELAYADGAVLRVGSLRGPDETSAWSRRFGGRDKRIARGGRRGGGGTGDDSDGTPIRIPIPGGGGYVEAGAHVVVDGKGVAIGDNDGGAPLCVHGVQTTSLSCTSSPPDSTARAEVRAKHGTTVVAVDEEVG